MARARAVAVRARDAASLSLDPAAEKNERRAAAVLAWFGLGLLVWHSRFALGGWYLREDGKNVTLWPGFVFQYLQRMRRVETGDFVGVVLDLRASKES